MHKWQCLGNSVTRLVLKHGAFGGSECSNSQHQGERNDASREHPAKKRADAQAAAPAGIGPSPPEPCYGPGVAVGVAQENGDGMDDCNGHIR
jgi:hypothetical protein